MCKYYTGMSNYAEKCKDFEEKKQTNAERIRSMSDVELAEFLIKIDGCLANAGKVDCSQEKECGICEDVIKKWLQSEVEELDE